MTTPNSHDPPPQPTVAARDGELLKAWNDGNERAGEQLVRRHLPRIHRFFANKACEPEDVAELVSQTFLRCTDARRNFRGDTAFLRFLYGIANNVLREDYRKRQKRSNEVRDFGEVCVHDLAPRSPSSIVMQQRQLQAFVDALRRVPIDDQLLLEQRYFAATKSNEIAETLGIPAATVRTRLMRARERLRAEAMRLLHDSPQSGPTLDADVLESWAQELRGKLGALGCET